MRPLIDWLRWKLFDFLQWQFPPEQPTEEEYIAYLKDKERHSLPELPIIEAVPQHTGPLAPELPEKLCWPTMAWSRYYFEQHPELKKPPECPRFMAPIRRVQLLPDDTWLTSEQHTGPFDLDALERQTEPTLHVPAVKMRALHPRR